MSEKRARLSKLPVLPSRSLEFIGWGNRRLFPLGYIVSFIVGLLIGSLVSWLLQPANVPHECVEVQPSITPVAAQPTVPTPTPTEVPPTSIPSATRAQTSPTAPPTASFTASPTPSLTPSPTDAAATATSTITPTATGAASAAGEEIAVSVVLPSEPLTLFAGSGTRTLQVTLSPWPPEGYEAEDLTAVVRDVEPNEIISEGDFIRAGALSEDGHLTLEYHLSEVGGVSFQLGLLDRSGNQVYQREVSAVGVPTLRVMPDSGVIDSDRGEIEFLVWIEGVRSSLIRVHTSSGYVNGSSNLEVAVGPSRTTLTYSIPDGEPDGRAVITFELPEWDLAPPVDIPVYWGPPVDEVELAVLDVERDAIGLSPEVEHVLLNDETLRLAPMVTGPVRLWYQIELAPPPVGESPGNQVFFSIDGDPVPPGDDGARLLMGNQETIWERIGGAGLLSLHATAAVNGVGAEPVLVVAADSMLSLTRDAYVELYVGATTWVGHRLVLSFRQYDQEYADVYMAGRVDNEGRVPVILSFWVPDEYVDVDAGRLIARDGYVMGGRAGFWEEWGDWSLLIGTADGSDTQSRLDALPIVVGRCDAIRRAFGPSRPPGTTLVDFRSTVVDACQVFSVGYIHDYMIASMYP